MSTEIEKRFGIDKCPICDDRLQNPLAILFTEPNIFTQCTDKDCDFVIYTLDEKLKRAKEALKDYLNKMTTDEYESFLFDITHDDMCDLDDCDCLEDCYVYIIFSRYTGDLVHMYQPMNSQYFSGYPMSIEDGFPFSYSPDIYKTFEDFKEAVVSEFQVFDLFQDEY